MSDDVDPLDAIAAPPRKDFRRVNNGVPMVVGLDGKKTRYSRSSSAGKILDDESTLIDWRIRKVLVGVTYRPDILAEISTLDPDRDKREFRELAEAALVAGKGREKANKGTAIHRMLDRVDANEDWQAPPQYEAAIAAYLDVLDTYGLVVVDIECQCVNDRLRLAGTLDRRYRTTRALIAPDGQIIPIGSVIVGDTKTGDSLEYAAGSYATQLDAYASSVRYDVATDERSEFDPPSFRDWALIMHVLADAGRCDVYWVDLGAGRIGNDLALSVRQWRKRTDLILPAMAPLRSVHSENVPLSPDPAMYENGTSTPEGGALGREEAQAPVLALVPPAAATAPLTADQQDALRDWLRGRIAAIRAHSDDAIALLARKWPTDVPGLKRSTQTTEELEQISKVIDHVEAHFSIPFGASDPRCVRDERSWVAKWSKPLPDDEPSIVELTLLQRHIDDHPRHKLLAAWSARAITGGLDPAIDNRYPLAHALYEFAMLGSETEWPDDHLTEMLDGSIRAIGYAGGIDDLGRFKNEDAPLLMAAAFVIASGDAILRYVDGKPIVMQSTTSKVKVKTQ